ncbi:MAG: KEOPS complex subunit Cgi121 [Haloarculaceae archaeon]
MELLETTATVEDVDAFVERLRAVGEAHGVTVQGFDARYVVDRTHLERALAFADRAIDRGENVARDRAMELLLYAAGRRQINRALEMGVSAGECPAVVLVDDPGADGGPATPGVGAADVHPGPDAEGDHAPPAPATAERDAVERSDDERRGADPVDSERDAVETLASMPELDPAETLGDPDPDRVTAFFDVSEAELAAAGGDLAALVHERVALLTVER